MSNMQLIFISTSPMAHMHLLLRHNKYTTHIHNMQGHQTPFLLRLRRLGCVTIFYLCLCTNTEYVNSGLMLPGLNAIMGPTGSGKTTYVHNL